ncbi:thioredoxin reductase (NADPH) [Nonlabens dokdonensis]|jgi:thioredoxin reductase (NADPH)|uniref:Thioredoxin reductase n=2 Tax=Nonlabens dokdonensis TaxID=328515 RepID=L7W5M9_NONDD|nr:YpdA family putative bacillithiol disulfide reductase [Nonlabens dokdonensis]AGC76970.1 thioredoxin reductase [Nonlabens dokdonensis DSW-6]PZX36873.1 thioredoxin reductase (NADPH) [Nonlabens dokdonensis]
MKNSKLFDVIIIGAGPIGINCALQAKKKGLSYLVIEKGPLVNSLYNYPANMQFFSTSEKLELDDIPFISKEAKPSKQEALEYYRRIATSNHLNINLFEKVEEIEKLKSFKIKTDKNQYHSKNIIVSTGFYDIPNKMNVKGEDLIKVTHYYNDPHLYAFQDVAVVGASNSAVDAALEIYRKGGKVTMIVRGASIGDRVKYWVKPDIENRIKEGSIKAYFNSEIKEILEEHIIVKTANKVQKLPNDFVVALTGYQPNFTFLKKIGIKLEDDKRIPSYNSETMETNVDGIFLAGVICGGEETHKWFIENSRVHAHQIISTIAERHKKTTF